MGEDRAGARGADPGAARCHGTGDERSWSVFGKPGAGNRRAVPCHAVCRARGGCGQPERQLCRRGCAAVSAPGCDSAVTQTGDACGVALGSILLFALVPRLCDSGPGAAGAESAGQRWRRGRGMRVVQRSPREQGRILCLPRSRRSLVAPQVPSGSSSSTARGSCAAAAAPALSRGSKTLSPGCPSSSSCREGLRGPKRRVPAPGQRLSIHPVAAGQEGICAPGPLSWLQPPSTGGSLAHGMGFNTVGISCFGVLRCGHQLEWSNLPTLPCPLWLQQQSGMAGGWPVLLEEAECCPTYGGRWPCWKSRGCSHHRQSSGCAQTPTAALGPRHPNAEFSLSWQPHRGWDIWAAHSPSP